MTDENAEAGTCGRGLAHHGATLGSLARYIAENADLLELHLPMLDGSDPLSVDEARVYRDLVADLRRASSALDASASQMNAARDMPMGRHLDSVEANAAMAESFTRFVEAEVTLVADLSLRLAEDQAMLSTWE